MPTEIKPDTKPDLVLPMTQPQYDSAIARVSTLPGVELTETKFDDHVSGIIRYKGIRVGFRYKGGELALTVLMVPVLTTRNYVVGKVREWLALEQNNINLEKSKEKK